LKFLILL